MNNLRIMVFRGLPKEIEEEVGSFLEMTPCQIQHVVQSESGGHITLTVMYEMDTREER